MTNSMVTQSITKKLLVTTLTLFAYWGVYNFVSTQRIAFLDKTPVLYSIPSNFTAPAALEFKGVVANYLFLKVMMNAGNELSRNKKTTREMVDYVVQSVETITDLDPKFWDPYLFSSLMLAWNFNEPERANTILTKAETNLPNDYRPCYFKGFNYYYFLKDNEKGAQYMIKASKLPGSPSYLPYLATRLSIYSAEHGTAAAFLEQMIEITRNESIVKQIKMRLETVNHLILLEEQVMKYKKMFGLFPKHLEDLVTAGFLKEIPNDPHGGEYIIMDNNRVYTTSRMIEQP